MILLLWILLILLPLLLGAGVLTIAYRKKTCPVSLAESYLVGCMVSIGITEVAHIIGLLGGITLFKVGVVLAVILFSVAMVSFAVSVYVYFKNKESYEKNKWVEKVPVVLPIFFLVMVGVQALFIYCMKMPVTSGDIVVETVQSFLAEDGIYKVLPLTGMTSEQGMPLRYTVLCLPTLYAVLSKGFAIEPELLVCNIMPIVVLAAAYLAYNRLGETLFGKEKTEYRFVFLLLVAVILMVSDSAIYMDGYHILHSGYTGVAIRNLVLIPYCLCAVLERCWWKAILCILVEACIAWTFWGCGVCVVITLGILFLGIFGSLCKSLAKRRSNHE